MEEGRIEEQAREDIKVVYFNSSGKMSDVTGMNNQPAIQSCCELEFSRDEKSAARDVDPESQIV